MKIFKITENDANQRLDKFLKKLLPNASLSLIYKLNRKEKVKIDSKKRDNEYKLIVWEEIKLFLKDEEFNLLSKSSVVEINDDTKQKLDRNDIVFEDSHILVINKPAWLIVHPWDFKTKDLSLIQLVHDYLWNKLNSLTFKPSLVHRIDKDTSWIIIVAKTKSALESLLNQLQSNKIEKIYCAITIWTPIEKNWIIKKKLLRLEWAKNENKIQINEEEWQRAVTHYKVVSENIKWRYSLIECRLETWRMHQIRIHLASIWVPILWDNTYWIKEENSFVKKNFWISRQLLHAKKIKFIHPETRKIVELEARLKDDMKNFLI